MMHGVVWSVLHSFNLVIPYNNTSHHAPPCAAAASHDFCTCLTVPCHSLSLLCGLVLAVQNLQSLQKATEDIKAAKKLFKDLDSDNSGGIDIDELSELMKAMSMEIEREALEEVRGEGITTVVVMALVLWRVMMMMMMVMIDAYVFMIYRYRYPGV